LNFAKLDFDFFYKNVFIRNLTKNHYLETLLTKTLVKNAHKQWVFRTLVTNFKIVVYEQVQILLFLNQI